MTRPKGRKAQAGQLKSANIKDFPAGCFLALARAGFVHTTMTLETPYSLSTLISNPAASSHMRKNCSFKPFLILSVSRMDDKKL